MLFNRHTAPWHASTTSSIRNIKLCYRWLNIQALNDEDLGMVQMWKSLQFISSHLRIHTEFFDEDFSLLLQAKCVRVLAIDLSIKYAIRHCVRPTRNALNIVKNQIVCFAAVKLFQLENHLWIPFLIIIIDLMVTNLGRAANAFTSIRLCVHEKKYARIRIETKIWNGKCRRLMRTRRNVAVISIRSL